jgi:hypothetical protein
MQRGHELIARVGFAPKHAFVHRHVCEDFNLEVHAIAAGQRRHDQQCAEDGYARAWGWHHPKTAGGLLVATVVTCRVL